ncbi:winged helix-turn-helix domain-containing protein [Halobellus inordinatus]|uniref:winged helix-turn-helix domain-containing protein n=1 Tax=Halobellus inordinatus TaxID=1126236 RepID=UPI0021148048|nr:winged helix-turn-helix domain-containing protein [Halobellus ramosii]
MTKMDDGPTPETNAHEILSILEAHAEEAFTQSEIAEATRVNKGSVGPTLNRLRDAGRVDHKGIYWRVSDHVRSLDATAAHADDVAASYEDEPIAYDEWQAHAVDPREGRE